MFDLQERGRLIYPSHAMMGTAHYKTLICCRQRKDINQNNIDTLPANPLAKMMM